jgi:hypothetical protein
VFDINQGIYMPDIHKKQSFRLINSAFETLFQIKLCRQKCQNSLFGWSEISAQQVFTPPQAPPPHWAGNLFFQAVIQIMVKPVQKLSFVQGER